ncbi:MAG TPA: epimerase, partial [Vicinamibacteria bacterium]|nr:epimerase [Vicinamibacteria bacterium]
TEADPPEPVGEYAQTCLGRERIFEHAARERGTPSLLFRLFYAVDLRYGTLVDVARRVHAGEPVSLAAGHVNAIWQGDASSYAFRSLALGEAPPRPLVVTGPQAVSVRDAAKAFGLRFGRPVRFAGKPGPALLGDSSLCVSLLGPPEVPLARLLDWVAAWVERGGRSLGKPTHFEATDGRF